jgi:hypothetical protein
MFINIITIIFLVSFTAIVSLTCFIVELKRRYTRRNEVATDRGCLSPRPRTRRDVVTQLGLGRAFGDRSRTEYLVPMTLKIVVVLPERTADSSC